MQIGPEENNKSMPKSTASQ